MSGWKHQAQTTKLVALFRCSPVSHTKTPQDRLSMHGCASHTDSVCGKILHRDGIIGERLKLGIGVEMVAAPFPSPAEMIDHSTSGRHFPLVLVLENGSGEFPSE